MKTIIIIILCFFVVTVLKKQRNYQKQFIISLFYKTNKQTKKNTFMPHFSFALLLAHMLRPQTLHVCAGSAGHPAARQPSHLSESPGKQLHKTRQQSRSDGALLGINERLISQVVTKKDGGKNIIVNDQEHSLHQYLISLVNIFKHV